MLRWACLAEHLLTGSTRQWHLGALTTDNLERVMSKSRAKMACLGLAGLFWATPAMAIVQDISADFRPDPSNPNVNRFTNTTPVSGYCAESPHTCEYLNIFSIRLPIVFESSAPLAAAPSDPRQSALWTVPVQWRPLTVVNSYGEQETVEVRISGIGSKYVLDRRPEELAPGSGGYLRRTAGYGAKATGGLRNCPVSPPIRVVSAGPTSNSSGGRQRRAIV